MLVTVFGTMCSQLLRLWVLELTVTLVSSAETESMGAAPTDGAALTRRLQSRRMALGVKRISAVDQGRSEFIR
jgi:hypothetical protein